MNDAEPFRFKFVKTKISAVQLRAYINDRFISVISTLASDKQSWEFSIQYLYAHLENGGYQIPWGMKSWVNAYLTRFSVDKHFDPDILLVRKSTWWGQALCVPSRSPFTVNTVNNIKIPLNVTLQMWDHFSVNGNRAVTLVPLLFWKWDGRTREMCMCIHSVAWIILYPPHRFSSSVSTQSVFAWDVTHWQ